jgi:hypothetical protein
MSVLLSLVLNTTEFLFNSTLHTGQSSIQHNKYQVLQKYPLSSAAQAVVRLFKIRILQMHSAQCAAAI